MSTLVIVLTAAIAVPGNGPKMELGEVAENRSLDLSGEWEGAWHYSDGFKNKIRVCRGKITFGIGDPARTSCFVDEGRGFCLLPVTNRLVLLGIYRQQSDCVMICFRDKEDGQRPSSFKRTPEQHLLILHRVKLRK